MKPNSTLTAAKLWQMVNRIEAARTPAEIRERCRTAEEWIKANEIITNDEFDDLMMAVSFIHRESYHSR